MHVRLTLFKYKAKKTYPSRLAGQRTGSVIDRIRWIQNILITSLVVNRDLPKDGRIVRRGRFRAWWWEVQLNGLLEGVIAWEVAELLLWSGGCVYDEKRGEQCER